MKKLYVTLILSLAAACGVQSAIIVNWSAGFDNGFSIPGGGNLPLPVGNEIRLGTFNLTDAQISNLINSNNLVTLGASFVPFASALMGEVKPGSDLSTVPAGDRGGHFEKTSSGDSDGLGLVDRQIYLWVFKTLTNGVVAANFSNVTHTGIFYQTGASDPDWFFPSQSDIPNTTTLDLTDLTNVPGTALTTGARVVAGQFPVGVSQASNAPNFALQAVPEPSCAGLALIGGMAVLLRRRRTK